MKESEADRINAEMSAEADHWATDHPKREVDQRGGGRQARQSSDPVRDGRFTENGRDV